MQTDRVVDAIMEDATLMTSDRVDALKGGHGGLVLAGLHAADHLAAALLNGQEATLRNLNAPQTPLDQLVGNGVDAARAVGATPSNGALITALLLYFCGTKSRSGIPAANRKLGAMCRLHAGAERGGVCQIPTPKMGNKISGFPAVQALYDAARRRRLTRIHGRYLPVAAYWGTAWGHSALGEDIILPEVATNGARIATRAMIEAYEGVGIPASPLFAAIFGSAAVAEILHGDAAAPETYGPYDKKAQIDAIYVAGRAAVEAADLPPTFHVLGCDQTFDAARFVGDMGLILKDIGAPTVVGMLWMSDLLSCFVESSWSSYTAIGPIDPPLGHTPTQFLPLVLNLLLSEEPEAAAARLREVRREYAIDPETALVSMYIVARKAAEMGEGPVTQVCLQASRKATRKAVEDRVEKTRRILESGGSLEDAVRRLEAQRQQTIETNTAAVMSEMLGRSVSSVRFTRIAPQARRRDPITKKYLAFDAHLDVEVTIDGRTRRIEHLFDRAVPATVKPGPGLWVRKLKAGVAGWLARHGKLPGVGAGQRHLIPHMLDLEVSAGVLGGLELTYAGCVILDVTAPAAVAAAMGLHDAAEAADLATASAVLSTAIPGARERAFEAARRAGAAVDEAYR